MSNRSRTQKIWFIYLFEHVKMMWAILIKYIDLINIWSRTVIHLINFQGGWWAHAESTRNNVRISQVRGFIIARDYSPPSPYRRTTVQSDSDRSARRNDAMMITDINRDIFTWYPPCSSHKKRKKGWRRVSDFQPRTISSTLWTLISSRTEASTVALELPVAACSIAPSSIFPNSICNVRTWY